MESVRLARMPKRESRPSVVSMENSPFVTSCSSLLATLVCTRTGTSAGKSVSRLRISCKDYSSHNENESRNEAAAED